MKAILIDVERRELRYVKLDDGDTHVEDIQKQIGCNIFTIGGGFPNGDVVYVDDEGLLTLTEDSVFFQIKGMQVLAGNGLILGTNSEGESESAKTRLEDIKVTFYNRFELQVHNTVEAFHRELRLG